MMGEVPEDVRSRAERFELEARPFLDHLYAIAYRMTRQASSAEGLVQEALLRAFQAFGRFREGTNFRAWIVRILTNVHINTCNRKSTGELSMDPTDMPPAVAPEAPPGPPLEVSAEDFGRNADVGCLRGKIEAVSVAALEKVPPPYRIIFLLSSLCELSYAEISGILEIPMGTVMSRLYRARRILRGWFSSRTQERRWAVPQGAGS
jgi:RNA polymerase sigma-70 factor (ECF subfamily)